MVGMMSKGNLVESGKISDVITRRSNQQKSLILESLGNLSEITNYLNSQELVGDYVINENELIFSFNGDDENQAKLLASMINQGFRIKSLRERKKNIEEILLEINNPSTPASPKT